MNDEQLIETLKNINENCVGRRGCYGCEFRVKDSLGEHCQIMHFIKELSKSPNFWNTKNIERIINER